jgi:hypothetical protein
VATDITLPTILAASVLTGICQSGIHSCLQRWATEAAPKPAASQPLCSLPARAAAPGSPRCSASSSPATTRSCSSSPPLAPQPPGGSHLGRGLHPIAAEPRHISPSRFVTTHPADPHALLRLKRRAFRGGLDHQPAGTGPSLDASGNRGELLVRHFVERWEDNPSGGALVFLLRTAVTNDAVTDQLQATFNDLITQPVARLRR